MSVYMHSLLESVLCVFHLHAVRCAVVRVDLMHAVLVSHALSCQARLECHDPMHVYGRK